MTTIIHAGFHKTGSTAMQEYLFANRLSLESKGLAYPMPLCKYASHAEIAWAYLRDVAPWRDKDYAPDDVWNYYDEIIADNEEKGLTTLISNEDISLIEMSDDWFDAFASRARRFNPTILVYVRDPVDYLGSTYGHAIIEGATRRSFRDWLSVEFHYDAVDYRRRLLKWQGAFGEQSIVVREYAKGKAIEDLLKLFSVETPDGFVEHLSNPGIHPWFTEAYRALPFGPASNDARKALREASLATPAIDFAEFYLGTVDADALKSKMSALYSEFKKTAARSYRSLL